MAGANAMKPRRSRGQGRAGVLALFAGLTIAALAREARAQDFLDLPIPDIGPPPLTVDLEQAEKRAFWRAGRERLFFGATAELGNLYLRTGASLGYGKPYWSWIGVEGSSSLSPGGGIEYAGLRYVRPGIDFHAGARYVFTTNQRFLVQRPTYTRDQTEETYGDKVRYVSLEAELAGAFPVLRGSVVGVAGVYGIQGTPEGWNLFDPILRIVAKPPWIWRGRLGYLARVDRWDMFRLGAMVEVIGNPPRGEVVVRAGPAITVMITHHLEAFGTALLVLSSPDSLVLNGAQFGELGFRYRWATGDRWPEFP